MVTLWCSECAWFVLILRRDFITIIIRQFPTKQGVSCALAFYLSFLFFSRSNGINLLLLLLFREGKQFLARLCTLYTGRERKSKWKRTHGDLPPYFDGQFVTVGWQRDYDEDGGVTVQHTSLVRIFLFLGAIFSSHSATDKGTEIWRKRSLFVDSVGRYFYVCSQ